METSLERVSELSEMYISTVFRNTMCGKMNWTSAYFAKYGG